MESLKEKEHSEDLGVGGKIILKWKLGKQGFGVWIGFILVRIGKSGMLF